MEFPEGQDSWTCYLCDKIVLKSECKPVKKLPNMMEG
jgi:hypothetical protein